ncbi:probable inactive protein kinase DDB_G0270444 [Palaemon carinicauda]|uniref:probable inactive protein kinase DDB_G0270444 n=1 Tax=Palaemon carinicauda TaxID=392227 RepID=UPI0035B5FDB1
MRKFWAEEEKSEALEPVLDQEKLYGVSGETEAVISGKDPLLSGEEEQDVDVQVETEHISNRDVEVQTDGDTEIEDLRRKNENMAKELANKQAVIEAHENQLADYYQSILKLKAKLKMAQEKNDVQNQMESALVREKEALRQELEDKEAVFTITKKNEGLREQLENKIKREENLNGKTVQMTNIQDQMKKEFSAAKDVISSLQKELQKRVLENVIKEEGMGNVERCETAAEDDKKIVIVKEEKQEGEDGPTRKLLIRKPKKKKPKRDKRLGYSSNEKSLLTEEQKKPLVGYAVESRFLRKDVLGSECFKMQRFSYES